MDNQLHRRFNALGDATRLAVVTRLLQGPASVSELAIPFAMALPPFMKHLGVLEGAGLIRTDKRGRVRTCFVQPAALDEIDTWFHDRRSLWRGRLDRLDRILKEEGDDANTS